MYIDDICFKNNKAKLNQASAEPHENKSLTNTKGVQSKNCFVYVCICIALFQHCSGFSRAGDVSYLLECFPCIHKPLDVIFSIASKFKITFGCIRSLRPCRDTWDYLRKAKCIFLHSQSNAFILPNTQHIVLFLLVSQMLFFPSWLT